MSASNKANASINDRADSPGLDLLWGIDAFSAELNLTRRQWREQWPINQTRPRGQRAGLGIGSFAWRR